MSFLPSCRLFMRAVVALIMVTCGSLPLVVVAAEAQDSPSTAPGSTSTTTTVDLGTDDPAYSASATGAPYWIANPAGDVWNFGSALNYGSLSGSKLNKPIVGIAPTPTKKGYWLVASDGGIFSYGDARFFGSTGSIKLNKPIVGMAPTPTNLGYWLVASDGGIFSYGDARFFGAAGVGDDESFSKIVPTGDGKGYWLMHSAGDAVAFGSASPQLGANATTTSSAAAVGSAKAPTPVRPAIGLIHDITGPGDLAMEYALRQVGKPYLWGATGPASFDCSGLTLRAWELAGATIPRVANDQYNTGTHVPLTSLIPGDLLFWADDINNARSIEHVATYVGGGNIVDSPHTGAVVRITLPWSQGLMAFAVRPR